MNKIFEFTLSNGIRTVYKKVENTNIIHCGFLLDIGSRDEENSMEGIAHFWEHMAFKGTKKRKAYHIINRLDSVGGELNAFTTKEKIAFFASVSKNYFENALDLLKDITFDSIFPENQIDKERNVILEEIAMYKDSPEDEINDEFDELIFKNHPLGHNILGNSKQINTFKRDDFKKFINKNINTEKIVFSAVGNIDEQKFKKLTEKYLTNIPELKNIQQRNKFTGYQPITVEKNKNTEQALCVLGSTTIDIHHKDKYPLILLNNILGGPAMNSRLNLALREKKGFVYSIESSFTPFTDSGMFSIYFGTRPDRLYKSMKLVKKEMSILKEKKLGVLQLSKAKEQLIGQLQILEENNSHQMIKIAGNLLDYGRIDTIDEKIQRIREIDAAALINIANVVFDESKLSVLTYNPN